MAKNQEEIEVVSVFCGEREASEVFTDLITQKIRQKKMKKPLAYDELIVHNEGEVSNHAMSGLCG